MSLSRSALGFVALALLAAPVMVAGSLPAAADNNHGPTSGTTNPARALEDWEVFGFDLSSIPDDPASLAAFKASLDPTTQRGIYNRCRFDIGINPFRYSPKVRDFCWAR